MQEMMDLLPEYYSGNQTMETLQNILIRDINILASNVNETVNECFVSTATEMLTRYEKIYGIEVDVTKSAVFRRERIIAKAKGTGTITAKMLEDVASSYSNGEVKVIDYPSEYRFVVKFVGTKGLPPNMADLTITIGEIKPAHLAFTFEYTWITWDEFDGYNKTFDQWDALNLTWNEFEEYSE